MDIEFARTFLAVASSGNFVGAARQLHVTQSTVSARIQTLESQLGAVLFRRGRDGAELTSAGHRFLRHAQSMIRSLAQARQEVGLPEGFRGSLTLSGRLALWDGFLPRWVAHMRERYPDVSLRVEVGFEEGILSGLVQGTVDVGVLYVPETRPGLGIERLFDEKLVLVTSDPARSWRPDSYIHMDWGTAFQAQFVAQYPDLPPPAVSANLAWVVLQQILHGGGSGYVPFRIVSDLLASGQLQVVPDSPFFSLPAYMVFPLERCEDVLMDALAGLRFLARQEADRPESSGGYDFEPPQRPDAG